MVPIDQGNPNSKFADDCAAILAHDDRELLFAAEGLSWSELMQTAEDMSTDDYDISAGNTIWEDLVVDSGKNTVEQSRREDQNYLHWRIESDHEAGEDTHRMFVFPLEKVDQPEAVSKPESVENAKPASRLDNIHTGSNVSDHTEGQETTNAVINRSESGSISTIQYETRSLDREFRYDDNGRLNEVIERDKKGERTYVKKEDGNWVYQLDRIVLPMPGDLRLNQENGDYSYQIVKDGPWIIESPDGSNRQDERSDGGEQIADRKRHHVSVKPEKTDGPVEDPDRAVAKDESSDKIAFDSIEQSYSRLMQVCEANLDKPDYEKFREMTEVFQERMADRAYMRKMAGLYSRETIDRETEQRISGAFDHLADMIESDDPDAFYTKDLRARLATTFMFHAQDPTLMDQGINNGTCWIQQGHVWAMVQHPDAMADLLKQIALKGKYTTKNSGEHDPTPKTYEFLKSYLSFPHGSEEAGWTIEKADAVMNSIGQKNVYRSPVGKIFDNVLPILGNRKEVDGGCYATRKTPEGLLLGSRGIIYSITGDILCDTEKNMYGWHEDANLIQDDLRLTLLEKGALNTYREGHGTSMHLRRLNGEWVIYHDDQHGEHTDWVISKISDIERWAKGDTSVEQPVRRRKR